MLPLSSLYRKVMTVSDLLFSRDMKFNFFKRISWGSSLFKINLVSLLCTLSSLSVFLFIYGDHTSWHYSKFEQTNEQCTAHKVLGSSRPLQVLLIRLSILLAMDTMWSICGFHDKWWFVIIPKSLNSLTSSNSEFSRKKLLVEVIGWIFLVIFMILHFFTWNSEHSSDANYPGPVKTVQDHQPCQWF